MLPDFGWTELLVIAIVLIVVVGPKDLPRVIKGFSKTLGSMRKMAGDFRKQFDEALSEAELDDLKTLASDVKDMDPRNQIKDALNPLGEIGKDINKELKDVAKSIEADIDDAPPVKQKAVPQKTSAKSSTGRSKTVAKKPTTQKTSTRKQAAKKPAAKATASKTAAAAKKTTATAKKTATKTASSKTATASKSASSKTATARKPATTARKATAKSLAASKTRAVSKAGKA